MCLFVSELHVLAADFCISHCHGPFLQNLSLFLTKEEKNTCAFSQHISCPHFSSVPFTSPHSTQSCHHSIGRCTSLHFFPQLQCATSLLSPLTHTFALQCYSVHVRANAPIDMACSCIFSHTQCH